MWTAYLFKFCLNQNRTLFVCSPQNLPSTCSLEFYFIILPQFADFYYTQIIFDNNNISTVSVISLDHHHQSICEFFLIQYVTKYIEKG